jgi:UDP-N-acetylmuramate-alanine ligase
MHSPDTRTLLLLGIRGMGMRGLAQLLHARGATILGADRNQAGLEFETDLREFDLSSESDALQVLDRVDGVIYSDAVPDDHPIRQEVKKKQIPNWPYQVALGHFAAHFHPTTSSKYHRIGPSPRAMKSIPSYLER